MVITIAEFAANFNLKPYYVSPISEKKTMKVIEVDRPGLEMSGFFEYHQKSRLVLIGKKEIAYLSHMSEESAFQSFLQICANETPGIIICHGQECPKVLLEAAKRKECSVYATEVETSAFEADALNFLSEILAPRTSMHAELLEIFGAGTLLIGSSGIGKSEVALDLIKKGHVLVADDKVDILDVRDRLEGSAPSTIYGMMEVRGIGIINVARMFGINALKRKTHIKYCLELVAFDPKEPLDRIGTSNQTEEILGLKIPYLKIPVSAGRSISELIEVAITNFKLKEYGYDSAKEFQKRFDQMAKQGSDKED